jgi:thioredoxin-related protein
MQKIMLGVVSAWLFAFACANKPAPQGDKLHWMTLEEAKAALQKEKRPLLIDLYTGWCGWCKVMDKKTYTNNNVIAYLQQHFYPVKLDAETRETLEWENHRYAFNSSYHTNEMALYLTGGQLSYPTTVIIPTDGSGPQAIPGYLQPAELELIVKYFGENRYGHEPFESWRQHFKASW